MAPIDRFHAPAAPDAWRRLAMRVFGCVLLAMACACSPARDLPFAAGGAVADYTLDGGDRLQITVYNEPDMTKEYVVDPGGFITLPLINTVPVRGKTAPQVENAIAGRLKEANLIANPSVSVQVIQTRPIYILGEVRAPGQFPYAGGMSVVTAVALAGGYTYRADKELVSITRRGPGGTAATYRATGETPLQPGDVVTVYERYF